MTDDELMRRRATCPICQRNGEDYTAAYWALHTHLEKTHTVNELLQQITGEAVLDTDETEEPPTCSAHGNTACDLCSLNPGDCAEAYGPCGIYLETGMHWDTCPNRIRSYEDAVERLLRHDIDGMGTFYEFTSGEGSQ